MYRFYFAGYCVDQVGVFTSIAGFLWTESAGAFLNLVFGLCASQQTTSFIGQVCGGRAQQK